MKTPFENKTFFHLQRLPLFTLVQFIHEYLVHVVTDIVRVYIRVRVQPIDLRVYPSVRAIRSKRLIRLHLDRRTNLGFHRLRRQIFRTFERGEV